MRPAEARVRILQFRVVARHLRRQFLRNWVRLAGAQQHFALFGNADFDPEPDWVNLNTVQVPQADEQQRLLTNLIQLMNIRRKPLPRFWYLPNGFKAAVIMSGTTPWKFAAKGAPVRPIPHCTSSNISSAPLSSQRCLSACNIGLPTS